MALLYTDPVFLQHETGSHPESADRLRAVTAYLEAVKLPARFESGKIVPASVEQLARVHSPSHVERVRQFAQQGAAELKRTRSSVQSPSTSRYVPPGRRAMPSIEFSKAITREPAA